MLIVMNRLLNNIAIEVCIIFLNFAVINNLFIKLSKRY